MNFLPQLEAFKEKVQSPEEDNAFQLPSTQEIYHLPLSDFYEHFLASEPASASHPIAHKPPQLLVLELVLEVGGTGLTLPLLPRED